MSEKKIDKQLTEVELELMNAVWNLGECTVKSVQQEISQARDLAYTSVATIMKILEQKGILRSVKTDKAHLYHALISKPQYESSSLKHLADRLFQGNPSSMVMRLLNDSHLSKADLAAIQEMIDERKGKVKK